MNDYYRIANGQEVGVSRNKRLLLQVSFILMGGFLVTSLVSYVIARSSVRDQIVFNALPLTSDNVYSVRFAQARFFIVIDGK